MCTSTTRLLHVDPVVILNLGPEGLGLGLRKPVNSAENLTLLVIADVNLHSQRRVLEKARPERVDCCTTLDHRAVTSRGSADLIWRILDAVTPQNLPKVLGTANDFLRPTVRNRVVFVRQLGLDALELIDLQVELVALQKRSTGLISSASLAFQR